MLYLTIFYRHGIVVLITSSPRHRHTRRQYFKMLLKKNQLTDQENMLIQLHYRKEADNEEDKGIIVAGNVQNMLKTKIIYGRRHGTNGRTDTV